MLVGLIGSSFAYQEACWPHFVRRQRTGKLGIDFERNRPNKKHFPEVSYSEDGSLHLFFQLPMSWLWQNGTLVQVGPLVVGAVAIWVALMNQRRQLNARMFIEFSARFQELLRLFPTDAWLANLNPSRPLPPQSQDVRDCTLYCIQLIADVYHLHQAGYITRRLWRLWEREIKHTITGPVFRREWEEISAEFTHNPDFFRYINTLIHSKRQMAMPESSLPKGK